ncbi:hypothetical protein DM01DRAFT_1331712 [Hesseltinella vesiculosa]|uniref:Uncharacterized protein n=1 Tax=Hesseltinella vesiculosa TaxID=101127 RepID=A0A1X2GW57_9FUNG|nr:hypothetical protein DM01DRAFT_1331712 [Hesseltinella vesiculosa]
MDLPTFEKALHDMPIPTLLTEIPTIQNSMIHLLRSNEEMEDFDPDHLDPDLTSAIAENKEVIDRQNQRIDLAIAVIRERINDAAAKEMADTVATFREKYLPAPSSADHAEEGVFL